MESFRFEEYEIDHPEPQSAAGLSDGDGDERPSPERFVPETMDGIIKAEHEARYRWAATVVGGKEVLDAGCGVGYGAQICAEAGAARVVGVDLSAEAVADSVFRAGHLAQFLVGDLQSLPLAAASFDVVVCFEAIEHVEHGDVVLDEFKRVLRPGGVVLLSSPNRTVYLPGNPHHVHEYTPAELEEALAQRFANVALYRQHPWITSLITDDAGFAAKSAAAEIDGSLRKVVAAEPGDEVYTVVAASDGPLPSLGGSAVMTDTVEIKQWYEHVKALEKQLSGLREERLRFVQEIAKRNEAVRAIQASLSWRLTRPLRSAKALAARGVASRRASSADR
jgi:ubiquinone/menaquinone biosynthesis C-methylase UbiE